MIEKKLEFTYTYTNLWFFNNRSLELIIKISLARPQVNQNALKILSRFHKVKNFQNNQDPSKKGLDKIVSTHHYK